MVADVKKAFYEAMEQREVCMEVPAEDKTMEDMQKDIVGELRLAMPGTRDAANSWQEEVARWSGTLGFERGKWNPCIYNHKKRRIKMMIHGDDFMMVCDREQVGFVRAELEKRFTVKVEVAGHGEGEMKEVKVLNRVVTATEEGWEYEADQRHAEIIVKEMGVDGSSGVGSPGEDEKKWEAEGNKVELEGKDARWYRGVAARSNYLGADRSDIQYAVKEVCREMSKPTVGGRRKMKRLGRYLVRRPRVVWKYGWQGRQDEMRVSTDSDWAGCSRTRESTSGGVAMIGSHLVKSWSRTQKAVALSSGEGEMIAFVKGMAEGLGMRAMCREQVHHGQTSSDDKGPPPTNPMRNVTKRGAARSENVVKSKEKRGVLGRGC